MARRPTRTPLRLVSASAGFGSAPEDGLTACVQGLKAVIAGFPDSHGDLRDLVVEGDMIAARLTGRGTHTGPFAGVAPTGRRIATQELVVHRLAAGKIMQCWGDLHAVVRDTLTSTEPDEA